VWSDRKAYQVVEITERPVDLWPEHFRKEWKRYLEWRAKHIAEGRDVGPEPDRATWEHRPLVLVLRPADRPTAKANHYAVRASRSFYRGARQRTDNSGTGTGGRSVRPCPGQRLLACMVTTWRP